MLSPDLASDLAPMLDRQRVVALALAATVAVVVFELVRRRKLREEYAWVWIATAVIVGALAWQQDLLLAMSDWIGAKSPVSTLFFGALLFLLGLVLQFSVRLSRLTHRHRTLGQRLALLEAEVQRLRSEADANKRDQQRDQQQRATAAAAQHDEVA